MQFFDFKVQKMHFNYWYYIAEMIYYIYVGRFLMDNKKDWNLELSEYIKQGEPNQVEKTKTWEIAIGLQDVDGLKPSKYLIKTAKEHIEGTIDIEEVKTRINEYY